MQLVRRCRFQQSRSWWAGNVPPKDIIDKDVNSADHTTLVNAVKAAGLVHWLKGPGAFTVFAPSNQAFAKLSAGAVENLLKPENKDALTKVLTYHVVAGRLSGSDLKKQTKAGGGQANPRNGWWRHAGRNDARQGYGVEG